MKVGIVGLPNVGKSSLFNLLTVGNARVDLYPFTTIEQNVGVVLVPDDRLDRIAQILKPEKTTPAHVEFVDIAGLVKGASAGEGLGNKFLGHIREADIVLHLVRAFADGGIPHVLDTVDPDRDVAIVEAELAVADLSIVERRLEHARKEPRTVNGQSYLGTLEKLHAVLAKGERPVLKPEEAPIARELGLIMTKPVIHAVNCSDTEPADPSRFPATSARTNLLFSAVLESGMGDFVESERVEMRKSLNLAPEGPAGIITRCFDALGLIRFYTVKGTESRAWAAPAGTTALEAAFLIHTDIGNGFVKAEVVNCRDLVACGDFHTCRDTGRVRFEGKTYAVQDGDVLLIKFR
jgi:GTP-binding protein YchF